MEGAVGNPAKPSHRRPADLMSRPQTRAIPFSFPVPQHIVFATRFTSSKVDFQYGAMKELSTPKMTNKFKAVFAKLKSRRRADSTKAKMAAAVTVACENEPTEFGSSVNELTRAIDTMDISTPPSLPIAPSGTFDFSPPPSSPTWPGPRYDDLVQFVPGIFNRSREMMLPKIKAKQKRAVVKRSSSHDDRLTLRRPSSKITKPPTPTKKKQKTTLKKPQFCRSPPTRADPLHLLSLPGEIRNQIYRYLYISKEPLHAQYRPIIRPHQGTAKPVVKRFPREPTLALVCKQLRSEASSLFYAENTFVFTRCDSPSGAAYLLPMTSPRMLTRWMTASSFTGSLTRVELCLGEKGRADAYARETIKYVFRRLADGSTELKHDLEDVGRCMCFDQKLLAENISEIVGNEAPGAENLVHAAITLVARRNGALQGLVHEADWKDCKDCGQPGWRRVEGAAR